MKSMTSRSRLVTPPLKSSSGSKSIELSIPVKHTSFSASSCLVSHGLFLKKNKIGILKIH